ncbi:MAG: DUF6088 family protein [Alphaproteobacteria bacterium]|nr:DUF6088 family protein [Alphaproteobacteria bacterium]
MKQRSNSLLCQICQRLQRMRGDVVLRDDFSDFSDYDQVGRVLLQLVRQGKLIKIGRGIYVRTKISSLDNKPALPKSLNKLTLEAMRRLRIPTAFTKMERAYNAGETTQVPSGRVIGVRKRVRRRISFNGFSMGFERVS